MPAQPSGNPQRSPPPTKRTSLGAEDGRAEYERAAEETNGHSHVASATPSHSWDHWTNSPALSILSYCFASILMTVVNKFVVSGRNFSMNFLLLAIQSAVSVLCVWVSKRAGLITYRDFDAGDAKKWFPVSLLLVVMIYTGSKSLQYLSIPVYTIFKNLTIILIAYGEVIWFGGRITALTLGSFGLMVLSSIIAAWADISHTIDSFKDAWGSMDPAARGALLPTLGNLNSGYIWMLTNCLAAATYLLTMRKRIKGIGFGDWDTMFYNNLLSVPVLVLFSFLMEDWGSKNLEINFPSETRNFLLFAIAFSGAAAVFISYSTAWCIRTTSSTTYSMVGSLNKLPVAASGMIFFGDPVTLGSVSAILAGFVAGLVYAFAKTNQKKQEQAQRSGETPMLPLHRRT